MVSQAVYSVSARTFPALPVRDYEIKRAVSDHKPDHAVARTDVSAEWVSVFKFPLHKLHSRIYELVQPILVQVERYGDGYLMTDENVNRHGVGPTIEDARQDYEEILLSYLESLSRRQESLSPRLRQDFEFLRRTVSHIE